MIVRVALPALVPAMVAVACRSPSRRGEAVIALRALPPGNHEFTLEHGGRERSYNVHVVTD